MIDEDGIEGPVLNIRVANQPVKRLPKQHQLGFCALICFVSMLHYDW